jgi:hypothetical protein
LEHRIDRLRLLPSYDLHTDHLLSKLMPIPLPSHTIIHKLGQLTLRSFLRICTFVRLSQTSRNGACFRETLSHMPLFQTGPFAKRVLRRLCWSLASSSHKTNARPWHALYWFPPSACYRVCKAAAASFRRKGPALFSSAVLYSSIFGQASRRSGSDQHPHQT